MYVQLEPSFERESRGMYATHYIVDYEGDYVPQNQSFYQRQLQPVFVAPAARDPAYLWYHQNHQILVPPPPPPPQRRPKDVAEQHVAQVLCTCIPKNIRHLILSSIAQADFDKI